MKQIIIIILALFIIIPPAFAGDAQIERVSFDGSCVKIVVSSNEDDSSDKFYVRATVGGKRVFWKADKRFRGLTTNSKFIEFCSSERNRAESCYVNVQIFHNRKLEDQYQWTGSRYKR